MRATTRSSARPGTPTIATIPAPNIRERITRYAQLVRLTKDRENGGYVDTPINPPQWLVSAVEHRGEWPGIRPLTSVSDVPFLRPDGSICFTPGWDKSTGVLYDPQQAFAGIGSAPITREDARAAAEYLLDPFTDFPFQRPEHRSAALAATLTPMARHAFDGPSPIFLVDANVRGAGKGLQVDLYSLINTGRDVSVSSYTNDVEELRKKITTIAMAGDRLVCLDNIVGQFGNDALDRMATATRWKDRALGTNTNVDLPLKTTWYATGNNIRIGADTARRVIHIRTEVMLERPEDRSGFKYADVRAHVRENHSHLLLSGLAILSAYVKAGRPAQAVKPFGSFEGWSGLVRNAIVWIGLPDPCLTREQLLEDADESADVLAELLTAWRAYVVAHHYGTDGLLIAELLGALYAPMRPGDPSSVAMRAAIESLVGCPAGKTPSAKQVGSRIRGYKRRMSGGSYFDNETTRSGSVWRVRSATGGEADA